MSSASPRSFSVPWDDCDTPSLGARHFEEMVAVKVWKNLLTDSNTREQPPEAGDHGGGAMEAELVGVKRRLERLHDLAETTDLDILLHSPYFRRITSVSVHWPKIGN